MINIPGFVINFYCIVRHCYIVSLSSHTQISVAGVFGIFNLLWEYDSSFKKNVLQLLPAVGPSLLPISVVL